MTPRETELLARLEPRPRSVLQLREQLTLIDAWGRQVGDLRGTFAAAYVVVTRAIEDAILAKKFGDPGWVTEVVLDFGQRYLAALRDHLHGKSVAYAWRFALAIRDGDDIEAIGALVSSMVAHIHYDLAHSLWDSGPLLPHRILDYALIGEAIADATRDIQHVVLDGYALRLEPLHRQLGGLDLRVTNAIVKIWRRRALSIAHEMASHPSKATWWSRRLNIESAALALLCNSVVRLLQNLADHDEVLHAPSTPARAVCAGNLATIDPRAGRVRW